MELTSRLSVRLWTATGELEAFLHHAGISLPRNFIHNRMESWLDEKIVKGNGPAYAFAVPLYGRWIAWRWPLEKVREEKLAEGGHPPPV